MERNILKILNYHIKFIILVLLEATYLSKNEFKKDKDFKLFFQGNWSCHHAHLGLSTIFMFFVPITMLMVAVFLWLIAGALEYLILSPFFIAILSVCLSLQHQNKRQYVNLFVPEDKKKQIAPPFIVESKETLGQALSCNNGVIAVIRKLFPERHNVVCDLKLEDLASFDLRDRLLIIDIILEKRNSVSEIVNKASHDLTISKQEIWLFMSEVFKASERNIRDYSEKKHWYKERISQHQILNRINKIEKYLEVYKSNPDNLKEELELGNFG